MVDPDTLTHHVRWLRQLARTLVRDQARADDLAQDAVVAALEKPRTSIKNLGAWLATVLRNFARQERRRDGRRQARERRRARPEGETPTDELVARLQEQRAVVDAIEALAEPYRGAILLRFYEGLAPREIARQLGIPVATVRTRLARGLAQLREQLASRHGGRGSWVAALLPLCVTGANQPGATRGHDLPAVAPCTEELPSIRAQPGTRMSLPLRPSGPPCPGGPSAASLSWWLMSTKLKVSLALLVLCGGVAVVWSSLAGRQPEQAAPLGQEPPPLASSAAPERGAEPEAQRMAAATEAAAAPASKPAPANRPPVRGRVLSVSGAGLDGVEVHATHASTGEVMVVATSGPGGRFEVPAADGIGRLGVESKTLTTVLSADASTGGSQERIVVVGPRTPLDGEVRDERGRPLPGTRLAVELPADFRARFPLVLDFSGSEHRQARSDAAGRFVIEGFARVEGAVLLAALDGYRPERVGLERQTQGLSIVLHKPERAPGTLLGTVVDERGAPVAGARVAAGLATTISDEQGEFVLELAKAGAFTVVRAVAAGALPAECRRPESGEPIVLRLGGAPLSLAGRVVDRDGKPRAAVKVWILDPGFFGVVENKPMSIESLAWTPRSAEAAGSPRAGDAKSRFWNWVATDDQGAFRIEGLLDRQYRLRVMDPTTLLARDEGPFAAGRADLRLVLDDDALFARVAGRVLSRGGVPIASARIAPMCDTFSMSVPPELGRGRSTQHERVKTVQTDAEGRFELERVPKRGTYLRIDGNEVIPEEFGRGVEGGLEELARGDPSNLEIRVDQRCHLQVTLTNASEADAIGIVDARGQRLLIQIFTSSGRSSTETAALHGGKTEVLTVPESAAGILLLRGDLEVRRAALQVAPGRKNELSF